MKKPILFLLYSIFSVVLFAADPIVSIYDEFDDGLFGKSIHRGVIVSIRKSVFARSETLPIRNDEDSYLTAVIMMKSHAEKLMNGYYGLRETRMEEKTIYTYDRDGLEISFSIEKAGDKLISMVSEYYKNDEVWHDPLVEYYRENYVLRIHSAENIFEIWTEEITYNEAMVAATLLGDRDQWLWGIHNGSDILNSEY